MPLNLLQQKDQPLIHPIAPGQPSAVGAILPNPANSPRVLPDLLIPGSLVISANLSGIGLGLANPVVGMRVVVNPYTSMDTNDQITVFFDNVPVATGTVLVRDQPFDLQVPYGAFNPGTDQTVAIHYRVVRASGGPEDSEPRLYRIKLTRPGGIDPSPEPQHQNLFAPVLPPHIAADGVSQADAQAGFQVTIKRYENAASYDVIDLRWHGHELPRRLVLPAEVGGNIEIDITADIIALGGDGTDLPIFYRVYDQVNNHSEDDRGLPWSVITPVFVHADPNALPAPTVVEALNGELRLDQLGSSDVHVQVFPYPPLFVPGDPVILTWRGQTAAGQVESFEQTLPVANSPGLLVFEVPNAKATAIGGGHAYVSYVLHGAAGPQTSVFRKIQVIGMAIDPGIPEFVNGEYIVGPRGMLAVITVRLKHLNGAEFPNATLEVTLPAGTVFSDGSGGSKTFTTDADGLVTVSGVIGSAIPGSYELTTSKGENIARAALTIRQRDGLGTIATGQEPSLMVIKPDATRLYITNRHDGTLSIIDPAFPAIIKTVTIGTRCNGLGVSPDGRYIYVISLSEKSLVVVASETYQVERIVPLPHFSFFLSVSPDGRLLYLTQQEAQAFAVVDTENWTVRLVNSAGNNQATVVSPDGRQLFLSDYAGARLLAYDADTLVFKANIAVGPLPTDMVCSPDGRKLYVGNFGNISTSVIDLQNLTVVHTIAGYWIKGVSPDSRRLYSCDYGNNTVTVFNADTYQVLAVIATGAAPLLALPSRDGSRLYVSNHGGGSVSILDAG